MLKIAVFDTENSARQLEDILVRLLFDRCEFGYESYTDRNAWNTIDFVNDFQFDIVFIEVNADVLPGIEIAKRIRETGNVRTEIIFLTSDDSFVLYGYKLHVFDYLLKPVPIKVLSETIDRYFSYFEGASENYFTYKISGNVQKIRLDDIYYFMSNGRKCTAVHMGGDNEFYAKLDEVEQTLNEEDFIRVHQSYIVRVKYIKSLTKDGLTLNNGLYVPVSQRRYSSVKSRFMQYLNI